MKWFSNCSSSLARIGHTRGPDQSDQGVADTLGSIHRNRWRDWTSLGPLVAHGGPPHCIGAHARGARAELPSTPWCN